MKIKYSNIKLGDELGRANALHWGHFFLIICAHTYYFLNMGRPFKMIFSIILTTVFYYYFNKTKKNLYYSFWSFSILLMAYLCFNIIEGLLGSITLSIQLFYILALIFLSIEMYTLYSPIYYPIVSWWEYDFRFKHDLKIEVSYSDNKYKGRLADLRRNAGCLTLFEEYDVGQKLTIQKTENFDECQLQVEVMSKRQYSIGRPINYGVKFLIKNPSQQEKISQLGHYWKQKKSNITNQKVNSLNEF